MADLKDRRPNGAAGGITPDELEQLLEQFNRVTESLRGSHELLQTRVAELTAELEAKNKLLERKSRLAAMGEMVAQLAHEIRNPLGGIELFASLLARDLAGDGGKAELVRKIADGVRSLNRLVEDMLNFTRELTPNTSAVSVAGVLESALTYCSREAGEKSIRVVRNFPAELDDTFEADPEQIERAFMNVILNAVQAMPDEGTLTLAVAPLDDNIYVRITDTGPGILPESIEKIFNPFFTEKEQGTGLGLAIVFRIVEAHGGAVEAAVRDDGRSGAVFTFRLPKKFPGAQEGRR